MFLRPQNDRTAGRMPFCTYRKAERPQTMLLQLQNEGTIKVLFFHTIIIR